VRLTLALLLLFFAASAFGDSESARLARRGRRAQSEGNLTDAYLLYARASALDPGNKGYRKKVNLLSAKVAYLAKPALETEAGGPESAEPDPSAVFDDLTGVKLQSPPELRGRPGRFDINLDGDYRTLFQQVATLFGLDCVFDSDYEPGRRIHFSLNQADRREALLALSAATNSFVVPLADKLFLVAKDIPQKRTDLEQAMCVTVPIPQYISTQELVELAQAVRQATGVEKLSWDNKTGSIIMRDRVSRVKPAQALFEELFAYRPEVMIDLQLIELTRTDIVNYGINLPNMFNIVFTGGNSSTSTTTTTTSSSATNAFPFNSLSYIFSLLGTQSSSSITQSILHGMFPTSLSMFSIALGEANALVNFSDSLGKTILSQKLRSVDAQPATFHYGDRYPILTGSFSAGSSATVGSQSLPTSSFTFEDLGITLKVTPHVHGMNSVSLDVESEFKLLTGTSNNGNPIISNRKLKSTVSLDNDEWAVIAGLEQNTDTRSVTGTAGLSQIPTIGAILSQHMKEKDRSELLIMMRPHLLSLPADQKVPREVWVGTESRPYTPL
jgi:general secretion pathway protein D